MIPLRHFSAFISRISLTIILVLISLFVVFSLTKHLFKTNSQRFVPVESHLLKNNRHHHHHHHHGESHQARRRV
jgi:predicted RND superfamily exporter protein